MQVRLDEIGDIMGKKAKRAVPSAPGGERVMDSRPTSVQILSTRSGDSESRRLWKRRSAVGLHRLGPGSPSVVLSSDADRIVFNAGEGWQRLCVEQGTRISRVHKMCFTHVAPAAVGGLPGYCLTAADAGVTNLALAGPSGLADFMQATRHFMQRDSLAVHLDEFDAAACGAEGAACFGHDADSNFQVRCVVAGSGAARSARNDDGESAPKRPKLDDEAPEGGVAARWNDDGDADGAHVPQTFDLCASYFCRTPPILGKRVPAPPFDIAKARELGVPPGPLYGQLKSGRSVTLADGRIIEPSACVEPTQPGAALAVIECTSLAVLQELKAHAAFQNLSTAAGALDCIVHVGLPAIVESAEYVDWLATGFAATTQHIVAAASEASPYRTALHDANLLHRLAPDVYAAGAPPAQPAKAATAIADGALQITIAEPLLSYKLVPRHCAGFDRSQIPGPRGSADHDASWAAALKRGLGPALEDLDAERRRWQPAAAPAAGDAAGAAPDAVATSPRDEELLRAGDSEILFLGTGSAIPSKHRNVSAIYVRTRDAVPAADADGAVVAAVDGQASSAPGDGLPGSPLPPGRGILLDCGEGSVGQLHKVYGIAIGAVLAGLEACWISHPHADHHLGLPTLLEERFRHTSTPLLLMAPWPVLRWLREYEAAHPAFRGTYTTIESAWMRNRQMHPEAKQLLDRLGLVECFNVRVIHCPQAYGLVIKSQSGWSLAYSGDCRPSPDFVREARGVSVLIHEATFEDICQDDAISKRHSTISEAIDVGARCGAHRTILTHFSQRYPTIPDVGEADLRSVVLAADLMHISLPQLLWAPKLLRPLQILLGATSPADGAPQP